MKKLMAVVALGVAVAFGASLAVAAECPLLIKQLNDAVGNVSDQAKAEEAKKLVAEAQELHDAGKHADSVKTAEEAAKVIGLELQHK